MRVKKELCNVSARHLRRLKYDISKASIHIIKDFVASSNKPDKLDNLEHVSTSNVSTLFNNVDNTIKNAKHTFFPRDKNNPKKRNEAPKAENSKINYCEIDAENTTSSNDCIKSHLYSKDKIHLEEDVINPTQNFEIKKKQFKQDLCHWALINEVSHTVISSLLHILITYFPDWDLPKQAKTLLHTPRTCHVNDMGNGKYIYFGIVQGIKDYLLKCVNEDIKRIQIQVGIDGAPVAKNQLWPILGRIIPDGNVFNIACYYAANKPKNFNEYLQDFVKEANSLIENGYIFNDKRIEIFIHSIICDTPAKAYVLNVKCHSGKSSCTKCTIRGKKYGGRLSFAAVNCELRTDNSVRNMEDADYHHGYSILFDLQHFDLVKQIPLDYMHLICIGTVKKLINLMSNFQLLREKSLNYDSKAKISSYLSICKPYLPKEFARRPNKIEDVGNWKATETRLFLMYIGIPALRYVYSENDNYFKLFVILHVASRILASPNSTEEAVDYAIKLMKKFVHSFKLLFSEKYISPNIHGLIHIGDDVKNLGSLDSFSAFPFENCIKSIVKKIRKSEKPLEQLSLRRSEMIQHFKTTFDVIRKYGKNECGFSKHFYDGPLIEGCTYPNYFSFTTRNYNLELTKGNHCCMMNNEEIICIENFATHVSNKIVIIGRKFLRTENLYKEPCESKLLNICIAKELSELEVYLPENIKCKCVKLPLPTDNQSFAIFPMMHCETQY